MERRRPRLKINKNKQKQQRVCVFIQHSSYTCAKATFLGIDGCGEGGRGKPSLLKSVGRVRA